MLENIANAVTNAIQTILVGFISPWLDLIQKFLTLFSNISAPMDISNLPFISQLISYAQAIAVSLLALRLAWEAYQVVALKADGAPTDPGGLLKRTVYSVVAIFAGPTVVSKIIVFTNYLALMIVNSGFGFDPSSIDFSTALEEALSIGGFLVGGGAALVVTGGLFGIAVILVILGLAFLICLQALARTVEITLAAIAAPFLSLGIMGGGGTFDVWWRETIVIAMSHPVQMLLLYLSVAFLVAPGMTSSALAWVRPFFFIASLWVTFKTPQIVRNYAYSTGTRSAIGSAGQAVMWNVMSKLKF
ncbi:conjugal transfer protein TrbL family protein [Tepidanaerobacter acetatoxydans]|uniref:conjugal transfer protein TrbL family protein n=1 Tax=Tepidanaerobacter acetatoxydans TaxID=499229 RepID=UPI001BD6CFC7|nr:conjugal transfer protein TrbL family protein [Tepidanaerobacter acetatoxydans]